MAVRVTAWGPLAAWVLVIFGVSSLPNVGVPHVGPLGFDKLLHMLEYGILGMLFARATGVQGARAGLAGALVGLVLGGLDELYQGHVAGREQELLDGVADVVGAALGGLAWGAWTRRRQRPILS